MNRLLAAFASNRVAANVLMALVVVGGLGSALVLRQEVFPRAAFDVISVSVEYPGAAPDEVSQSICVRIEEAIHGIDGVDRVFAKATEGFGAVWAELAVGADSRTVLDSIEQRVAALDTLPEDAERPIVQELIDDSVLLGVVIYGEAGPLQLRRLGERIRDDLSRLDEVTSAELVGVRDYEVGVEVSKAALFRHGLRLDDVARAVRTSALDLPGGALQTDAGEILVRVQGRAHSGEEYARVPVVTHADGSRVLLGDVAHVVDGLAESDEHLRFDGRPAVMVRVLASQAGDVLEVSSAVRRYVAQTRSAMPVDVALDVWADESIEFRGRRDLLLRNGAQGLALILVVLALFLRLRLAFWVSMGIPIAFLGAMLVLHATDVSINMMSMFAFIVALGLVVDDAIIVGESVARHQEGGAPGVAGAIAGAQEVAIPVGAAVLTTVLFIAPALSLPTVVGKISYSLGVVVIACLAFSVVEAMLILPAHLVGHGDPRPRRGGLRDRLDRIQASVDAALTRFIERRYRPWLERALAAPALTLACATALLLVALGALGGGWVRYAFFPNIEQDYVSAELVLPEGSSPERVERARARLETAASQLGAELSGEEGGPVVEHLLVSVGDRPDRHDDFVAGGDGPHVVHAMIALVPGEQRRVTSLIAKERWREQVGEIPGARSLTFRGSDITHGRPIDVSISGSDPEALGRAADRLARELAGFPGVREIADSQSGGKTELVLRIRPEAEAWGLSLASLARQVRHGFGGEEAQRVQRGRNDVAVRVRYPREERRSLRDLEGVRVRVPSGAELPFAAVAEARLTEGYSTVERRDLRRNISVTADVDYDITHPNVVRSALELDVFPRIAAEIPGVRFDLDGQSREEKELLARLGRGWLFGFVASFALLAIALRSYLQPILVLSAVPYGFVGAIAGHSLLGLEFSAFSMVGMVALTGVVVNDALLLVDCANRTRRTGAPLHDALIEAGTTRFRPILLTSLTTFFGLLPLLFERSAQAAWLKPMAVTLGFGVVFATIITLILVPAGYAWLEQLRERPGTRAAPEPAPSPG